MNHAPEHPVPSGPPHRRARATGSFVLIVLAAVLALPSALAVWLNSVVDDTNRYVATVAPLAGDSHVQDAVTRRVTNVVLAQIDVKSLVHQLAEAAARRGAPTPTGGRLVNQLSGPITAGLTDVVSGTVHKVVSSSAFATVWTEANRAAHSTLDKALTGKGGGAVALNGDRVTVDLGPVVAKVKNELVAGGFAPAARIPAVHTDFTVFSSHNLGKVRLWFRLLQLAGTWLPVVTVLVAATGVLLANDRRRALIGAGLAVAAAMLVLGLTLTAFRYVYLDRLPPDVSQPAAAAVYDTLIRFLRVSVRAIGALALVTAIGAFLIGPSRAAVTVRSAGRSSIGALREVAGVRPGAAGRFVHRRKRWLGALILAVAAVVLFLWSYPTTPVVLWITAAVLAGFAIREFLDTGEDH